LATDPGLLFSLLAAKYGIGTALGFMPLFSGQATAPSKAFAGAGLAGSGAQLGGLLSGNQSLSNIGKGIGTGLGLAGTGYGIYQTATNPNLSTRQKAGHSGILAGEAAGSLAIPYFGAGVAAKAVIDQLRRSGSPQVAATGRALGAPALPIEGLLSVIGGDQSPRQAFNSMVENVKRVPILGKPAGAVMNFFGLGTKPTTGTMFRRELGNVLKNFPQIQGANLGLYNAPTAGYEQYNPQTMDAVNKLAGILTGYTPHAKSNMPAYNLQAQNILLNTFGNQIPALLAATKPAAPASAPTTSYPTMSNPPATPTPGVGIGLSPEAFARIMQTMGTRTV
jgi:hypothetical protein